MKKEIRTKTVEYPVYITDDGKEFDGEQDAVIHEKLLSGEIKECPECHGEGVTIETYEYDNYHTGVAETMIIHPTCTRCGGKGYLERKTTWV